MGLRLRLALLLPFAALLGCGNSASNPPQSSNTAYINVTGNWSVEIATTPPLPVVGYLTGSLTSSGSAVTGIFRAEPLVFPLCISGTQDLTASGMLDTSGNLTLTFPIAGGMASLSGNFTESTNHILTGTYQVVGGACAQSAITVSFFEALNVTGTYSGTVNTGTGTPSSTVTAILVQSATPDSDGLYPLSGTVTSVGACNSTLTFTQGVVFGDEAQSFPFPADPVPVDSFVAVVPAFNTQLLPIAIFFQPSGCGAGNYEGRLTRQ